jgi:hypothetical protein
LIDIKRKVVLQSDAFGYISVLVWL